MPKLTKWERKLSPEMMVEAVKVMACGTSGKQAARNIKEKYGISITDVRLYDLCNNKYAVLYNLANIEYIKKLADLSDIEIYSKRERMKDAEKLRKKTMAMLDKINIKIDKDLDEDDLSEGKRDYMLNLIKAFKDLMTTQLKILKSAKEEAAPVMKEYKKQSQPSLLQTVENQQINIGVENSGTKEIEKPAQERESVEVDRGSVQTDNPGNI